MSSAGDSRGPTAAPRSSPNAAHAADREWIVPDDLNGRALDAIVRTLADTSWSEARRWIETGKIRLAGQVTLEGQRKIRKGARISLHMSSPRPRIARVQRLERDLVVHLDAQVVVVRKPAGMSSVPFGDEPEGELTLDALVRDVVARRDKIRGRAPLGVVHRLDKATTGLLVFSRTVAAKKHLSQQFRVHSVHRRYLAIVHGQARTQTIRTHLIENRGDGLRGSVREGQREGQLAITHVELLETLQGASLVRCQLETGRTHQIRIHLAEQGNPLVGETVYIRGFRTEPLPAPRLMLHAAELGFEHPDTGEEVRFEEPLPDDFTEVLNRLRIK
jgi:23S rRNA pseudouridine1911/1915/1917 synthase